MQSLLTQFASEKAAQGNLFAALGIDWRILILQIVAFLILVWLLSKYVYPWLLKAVDERHDAIEASAEAAKEAQLKAEAAEENTEKLLKKARGEAADILALAQKEASKVVEDAETKAAKKADHLVEQAEARIQSEVAAAKVALRSELTALVATATEKVLNQKVDSKTDAALISDALKETK